MTGQEVRGRVWQMTPPRPAPKSTGWVWTPRRHSDWSGATWAYEVTVGGVVVASDNTGYWRPIYDRCQEVVTALRLAQTYGLLRKVRP